MRVFQRSPDTRYTGYKTASVGIIKEIAEPSDLQNQCSGEELLGGFDSHALPPFILIVSRFLLDYFVPR